ncbi:MAG: HypC/HybG/HupF family hydrogenase formation chaperone [bacterium]|nr:HypC/HybG/HupF family hydrogenase formation chaperone [bacterium]
MCLAIPGKIIKIDKNTAVVDFGGIKKESALDLLSDAKIGDYVLVHAGFAISKIDKDDALETLKLLNEIDEFKKLPESGTNKKNRK